MIMATGIFCAFAVAIVSCRGSDNSSRTPTPLVSSAEVSILSVGHTTSTNYPVAAGAVQKTFTGPNQNGAITLLTRHGSGTQLTYSTYLGRGISNVSQVRDVYVDPQGNIYVGGTTGDTALPTTPGVLQPIYGGGPDDGFIAKFSPTGTLLWLSYLGGNNYNPGQPDNIEEKVYGIAGIGPDGNLVVCGRTPSANFPVTQGAFHTTFPPKVWTQSFVTKITPDGSAIVWSTLVGGTSSNGSAIRGRCILDSKGNVYAAGVTTDPDFPVTPGAYQPTNHALANGGGQGFVFEMSSGGSTMMWSTYLGGSVGDALTGGIALDVNNNVYAAGHAASPDYPVTLGAYQTTLSGKVSCVISELRNDGAVLLASTYLGGSTKNNSTSSGYAECMAINLDAQGNVVAMGITPYKDFPTTRGVYQPRFGGGKYDGFVSRLTHDLKMLSYSTFIGGSGNEAGDSSARIEFDLNGNIYTGLATSSIDFPTTSDAYLRIYAGGPRDAVIIEFDPTLHSLLYGSYLGGNGDDFNRSMRIK
jgi:hypothetical protein